MYFFFIYLMSFNIFLFSCVLIHNLFIWIIFMVYCRVILRARCLRAYRAHYWKSFNTTILWAEVVCRFAPLFSMPCYFDCLMSYITSFNTRSSSVSLTTPSSDCFLNLKHYFQFHLTDVACKFFVSVSIQFHRI